MPTRLLFSFLLSVACVWAAPPKPNVLFLFTDDQPAGTIHALGASHIRTPHIDRLVDEGTAFTNAYIMGGSSPGVCLPSRAMLLSGRTLWNVLTPYVYGGADVVVAQETSERVDLKTETEVVPHVMTGAELRWWHVSIGAEVHVSDLTSYQVQIGALF